MVKELKHMPLISIIVSLGSSGVGSILIFLILAKLATSVGNLLLWKLLSLPSLSALDPVGLIVVTAPANEHNLEKLLMAMRSTPARHSPSQTNSSP